MNRAPYYDSYAQGTAVKSGERMRACNCIGPQNGAPACPCMMPEHNRRKMADMALEIFMRGKPRVRVKAGRREVAA